MQPTQEKPQAPATAANVPVQAEDDGASSTERADGNANQTKKQRTASNDNPPMPGQVYCSRFISLCRFNGKFIQDVGKYENLEEAVIIFAIISFDCAA